MPNGDCFHCNKPGHWAFQCPLKTPTKTTASPLPVDATSPPVIHCPCDGGTCPILTSKTEKNPNRRFYKCPSVPSCGFFKWYDEVNIKSQPLSDYPTCPCGSGPCRRETFIEGPNAHRSYFVCCIKKGFGACGFFQWENDAQIQSEPEETGHINSPCSTLIRFLDFDSVDDENLLHETDLKSDANIKSRSLGMVLSNEFTLGKEPIPVCSSSSNLKPVSNGVFVSSDCKNQEYKDAVRLETKEKRLLSFAPKHLEYQMEGMCNDVHQTNGALLEFNGKESYTLEVVEAISALDATGLAQNTNDPVSNGANKAEHINQSNTFGETGASFSGSLMILIKQYNLEKLHLENVSIKHADALRRFTGSYKQLESVRGQAHSLRKQLLEVERQVKLYEVKTLEFSTSLEEVSDEMVKSQKKMVETAGKVVKEVRVYKQRDAAAP